jgi:hypothetical protein
MNAALRRIWPASALAGVVGSIAGLFIDPHALLASYLAAAVAWSAISLGALAVLLVTYVVRGEWTEGLHAPLTAAALMLPVAGLLFVPVLIAVPWLYPWAAEVERHGALQGIYLTPWFFIVRTIAYFIIWTMLVLWARDAWGDLGRMIRAGSVGLIVYALTGSFAGIDWIESLSPEFHSSVYGLLFVTFQILAGFAFALFVVLRQRQPTLRYGDIFLSILLLWAYIHAMQYIVIWSGDIPDELVWYLHRSSDGWGVVLTALVLLQFVIPFFAMLSERVRYGRGPLLVIAGGTLALRFVEAFWLVLPSTSAGGPVLVLTIPATVMAIGGVWLLAFAEMLRRVEAAAQETG